MLRIILITMKEVRTLFSATVDGLKIETNKWGKNHLAVIDIIVLILIAISLVNNISSFKNVVWYQC